MIIYQKKLQVQNQEQMDNYMPYLMGRKNSSDPNVKGGFVGVSLIYMLILLEVF